MTKFNRTTMKMHNVSYVDKPNAIRKFILAGFSINDITIRRINSCHYDMVAIKEGI